MVSPEYDKNHCTPAALVACKVWTRSTQSAFHYGWGEGRAALSPCWDAPDSWWVVREAESIFFKSVGHGRWPQTHILAPLARQEEDLGGGSRRKWRGMGSKYNRKTMFACINLPHELLFKIENKYCILSLTCRTRI